MVVIRARGDAETADRHVGDVEVPVDLVIRGSSTPYSSIESIGWIATLGVHREVPRRRGCAPPQVRDVRQVVRRTRPAAGANPPAAFAVADRPRVRTGRGPAGRAARSRSRPAAVHRSRRRTPCRSGARGQAGGQRREPRVRAGQIDHRARRPGARRTGSAARRPARSTTVSSPTLATPGLIVEITSNPGWDGAKSCGSEQRVGLQPMRHLQRRLVAPCASWSSSGRARPPAPASPTGSGRRSSATSPGWRRCRRSSPAAP